MEEKKQRFFYSITLGNIFTIFSFIGASIALYTNLIDDVRAAKQEIVHLKDTDTRRDKVLEAYRLEVRQDIRDVKTDVNKLDDKVDKILFEIRRR